MKRHEASRAVQRSYKSNAFLDTESRLQQAETLQEINEKMPALRDYFAAKAMTHTFVGVSRDSFEMAAERAYQIADAMLEARK